MNHSFNKALAVTLATASLTVLSVTATQSADTTQRFQPTKEQQEDGLQMVSTQEVSATLMVAGKEIQVSGRTSLSLAASEAELEKGTFKVDGFNVAFFGVPQRPLAGNLVPQRELGVVGFAAAPGQSLKYDSRTGAFIGEIRGEVDAGYMSQLIGEAQEYEEMDAYETATQAAVLHIQVQLDRPVKAESSELQERSGKLDFKLVAEEGRFDDHTLSQFEVHSRLVLVERFEFVPRLLWEVGSRLCVQPVRIGRISLTPTFPDGYSFSVHYTGAGLAFGKPNANALWNQADIVFDWQTWKTLWKPGYWKVDTAGSSTSTEEANLKAEVTEDGCIEVFFIDDFNPESAHGGGATWGSGTAGSQIITSDGNAHGGVDFTHLAHELGHVLDLGHPAGSSSSTIPGSTGTLMCPSGWMNDNPAVNSQQNKSNMSNPLLQFVIKPRGPAPNCTNSADCGSC